MKTTISSSPVRCDTIRAIVWRAGRLQLLDQRRLPAQECWLDITTVEQALAAIRDMAVRGAPAIGVAAAYAAVLAAQARYAQDPLRAPQQFAVDLAQLAQARPTAINLRWALARMQQVMTVPPADPVAALLAEAQAIHQADIEGNYRIGAFGAALLPPACAVLTHCNAGALATGGYGTALGVVRAGWVARRIAQVFATETRPWLQGARLTAWELVKEGIALQVIADSAAAALMRSVPIDAVIVGADRIAANGDVANKIGTYALAQLARAHGARFIVAAPTSTIDLEVADGAAIPIEHRDPDELLALAGRRVAAAGITAWNPVFDVTPAALVDTLITERGVIEAPDVARIQCHLAACRQLTQ